MGSFASYSSFTRRSFDLYLLWNFRKHFSSIICFGEEKCEKAPGPLLFVANHVSWWDGFFLFELQRRVRPRAQIYTVALDKTCKENPILTRMGVLPLVPGNTGSLKALFQKLKSLREELRPEDLIISFFPQGKISPSFVPELNFQRGVESLIETLAPISIIPVGIHIEPMIGKKPTAFISIGKVINSENKLVCKQLEAEVGISLKRIHHELYQNGEKITGDHRQWF